MLKYNHKEQTVAGDNNREIRLAQPEKRLSEAQIASSEREAIPLYYNENNGQPIACIARTEDN